MVAARNPRLVQCAACGETREYYAKDKCSTCYARLRFREYRQDPEVRRSERQRESLRLKARRRDPEIGPLDRAKRRAKTAPRPLGEQARKAAYDAEYREKHRDRLRQQRAEQYRRHKPLRASRKRELWRDQQSASVAASTRRWKRWTDDEIAVILRPDLTEVEKAFLTSRSVSSVRHKRQSIRKLAQKEQS